MVSELHIQKGGDRMNQVIERPLAEAKQFTMPDVVGESGKLEADGNSGSESSASGGSCGDSGDSASASPSGYGPMPESSAVLK